MSSPLLPASVPASQAHSLGFTCCFSLSPSPCAQALPKSRRVHLHSAAAPAHLGHPSGHPLLYTSLWPCWLRSHATCASLHGSARVISQAGRLTLSPLLMSPTQFPSYYVKYELLAPAFKALLQTKTSHSALKYCLIIPTLVFCLLHFQKRPFHPIDILIFLLCIVFKLFQFPCAYKRH